MSLQDEWQPWGELSKQEEDQDLLLVMMHENQDRLLPMSDEDQDRLLSKILEVTESAGELQEEEWTTLARIAKNKRCPPLLRCAALDQIARVKKPGTVGLLTELVDFGQPVDVRECALQNLRDFARPALPEGEAQLTSAPVGEEAITVDQWLKLVANDPSPDVRWWASVGR